MGDLPAWLEIGAVLDGKYTVVRLIGKGGMGAVYEAQHGMLGSRVALKVLSASEQRTADAVTRFLREARASVAIHSDHVARVLDVGRATNGEPYLVMELLEGDDLATILGQRGSVPISEAVEWVAQAATGLAAAHAVGIVHRDVKPANLFLTRRPDGSPLVKVLDFGIAKASEPFQAGELTTATTALGTLSYMPPEQVKTSRDVDARADVYSLGVVLFELLTGRPLFVAPSAAELIVEILHRPAKRLSALRPDAPAALDVAIARATSKLADDRFGSAEAFATAIRAAIQDDGAGSMTLAHPADVLPSPTAPTERLPSPSPFAGLGGGAIYRSPASRMPHIEPQRPRVTPAGKAMLGTGSVIVTGGVLSFVAAALPGVVNGAEIGTAIGLGLVGCIVGLGLVAVGLFSRR